MPTTNNTANAKITEEEFRDGCENYNGICLDCGEIQFGGCEPDAEGYKCESCEANAVCGFEQALIIGRIDIVDDEDSEYDDD